MDPQSVLSKTAKGREEVETRKHKLDQRQRMLLITVNGKLTAAELVAQFSKTGEVMPLLDQLLKDGYISQGAADPAAKLKQAQKDLVAVIAEALGPSGDDIAIKIEAAKSLADLHAYLESRRTMLDSALGKARAPAFWTKVDSFK
jgi:hypothetical protein